MPIREGETVHALVSISFFTTAVPRDKIVERIVIPLRATTAKIEHALAFINGHLPVCNGLEDEGASF